MTGLVYPIRAPQTQAYVDPLTLLPQPQIGDVRNANGFPGKSWAINTPWQDTTGAWMTRLTNRSTLASGSQCALEYSGMGPVISQPMPDGLGNIFYWVGFNTGYCMKVQLSGGVVTAVANSAFALPNITGANIGHCFSQLPGEQNIMYIADTGTLIHRYDVNARAYSANAVFNGTNASYNCGYAFPGQCTVSWDGTRMSFSANFGNRATALFCLMLQTGTLYTYTGSPTSAIFQSGTCTAATTTTLTDTTKNWDVGTVTGGHWGGGLLYMTSGVNVGKFVTVNSNTATQLNTAGWATAPSPGDTYLLTTVHQVHMLRGATNAIICTTASLVQNQAEVWAPANGDKATGPFGDTWSTSAGHGECTDTYFISENPSVPGSVFYNIGGSTTLTNDGDPPAGGYTNYWNGPGWTGGIKNLDGHKSASWNRTGMTQYVMGDSYQIGYPGANANSSIGAIGSWTLYSGNIYSTVLTAGLAGSQLTNIGINEVLIWNGVTGSSNFGSGSVVSGHLTPAASLAAMTVGSFWFNISTSTLYCWMPDGLSPLNRVCPNILTSCTASIHFYNQGDRRRLCWIYTECTNDVYSTASGNYTRLAYTQVSPDGRIVISTMNLLTNDLTSDLVGIAMPYQGP